jgi:hypothetical protein
MLLEAAVQEEQEAKEAAQTAAIQLLRLARLHILLEAVVVAVVQVRDQTQLLVAEVPELQQMAI